MGSKADPDIEKVQNWSFSANIGVKENNMTSLSLFS